MVKVERKKVQELEQKEQEQKEEKKNTDTSNNTQLESHELITSKAQIQLLKQEIKQLEINIEQVQSENIGLQEQLDRLKVEKKQVQLENETLKEDLTNSKKSDNHTSNSSSDSAELQKENERLKQELGKAINQMNESNLQAETASKRADTFENKLSSLVNVLKELKTERANWVEKEAELQNEINALKSNNGNGQDEARAYSKVHEYPEYKEVEQKMHTMEKEIENYIVASMELRQELNSANKKAQLAENSCERLREEIERLKSNPSSQYEIPIVPSGPPKLPPPPPPPPVFKKLSGKLEIKKSNKPKGAASGDPMGELKTKLLDEISKGVTLRKVQPSTQPPKPPPQNENIFSLGAMASMLAKKRMARMSMRIDADDPMKGALDTLLMEVGHK